MEILYSDDRVIVCIKPGGVLSTDAPGGMPERLREALGEPSAVVKSVHRLDRTVSGVMVYARTKRAAADLGRQIADGTFRKEYLAVVHGTPENRRGMLRDHLLRDTAKRKTFVVSPDTVGAREAALEYMVLGEREDLSLLAIRLYTGRTHQIRCQLSAFGYPIVGDGKYGVADGADGIALLSHKVVFMHPRTGEEMTFLHGMPHTYPWLLFSSQNMAYDYAPSTTD